MSEERDEERPAAFKVSDRRRFSESGEPRSDQPSDPEPTAEPATDPIATAKDDVHQSGHDHSDHDHAAHQEQSAGGGQHHHEMNFATFVISLSTQALSMLGEIPDPMSGTTSTDLEAARQLIDILGILQDKTRGNLDADEGALLEHALYDLRMKYVERAQG